MYFDEPQYSYNFILVFFEELMKPLNGFIDFLRRSSLNPQGSLA